MKGRIPRPTVLKIADGNPGRRPINQNEPTPNAGAPRCPVFIKGVARKEWKRVSAELEKMGTAATADLGAMIAYCQVFAGLIEADAKVAETGGPIVLSPNKFPIQNPWLSHANSMREQLRKWCAELGLTPAARTRVRVVASSRSSGDSSEDAFEELFEEAGN